jgi:hypothetical protein
MAQFVTVSRPLNADANPFVPAFMRSVPSAVPATNLAGTVSRPLNADATPFVPVSMWSYDVAPVVIISSTPEVEMVKTIESPPPPPPDFFQNVALTQVDVMVNPVDFDLPGNGSSPDPYFRELAGEKPKAHEDHPRKVPKTYGNWFLQRHNRHRDPRRFVSRDVREVAFAKDVSFPEERCGSFS